MILPLRILVIDDDDTHLLATSGILEADGHEVLTHHRPFGATGRVLRELPDLVLLDVNMPALSGDNLARVIRARPECSGTALVLYSSNDAAWLRDTAARLDLDGFVCKGDPQSLRVLARRLAAERGR